MKLPAEAWVARCRTERDLLEAIDRSHFTWLSCRDYLETLWAWLRNTP